MDYAKIIRERRPKLRDNSVAAYALSLKSMAPPDNKDMDYLYDTKEILQRLEKYKPNTRKNHLNAAVVVLQGIDSERAKDVVKIYEKKRDKYQEDYIDQTKSHKKTASQETNWIEWDDYVELVDRMSKEVKFRGAMSTPTAMKFQDYLVALLYQHFPVRNDFSDLRVIESKDWNKMTGEKKTEHNYLIKSQTGFEIILNHYKTSDKYGQRRIKIDQEPVKKALRRWLRHNESGTLLINRKGAPLTSNGITKLMARVGQREAGRSFGSSLLRHSYLSHKYADVNDEKKKDAELMMHSVAMQEEYIKKDD